MSRVHERDTIAFNDVANATIATELESRLRELERNIAVARQFIKMADECYSQVRREWELLHQDTHSRKPVTSVTAQTTDFEEHEVRVEHDTLSRGTKSQSSKHKTSRASIVPTNLSSSATKIQSSTTKETQLASGTGADGAKKAFRSPRPKGKERTRN